MIHITLYSKYLYTCHIVCESIAVFSYNTLPNATTCQSVCNPSHSTLIHNPVFAEVFSVCRPDQEDAR